MSRGHVWAGGGFYGSSTTDIPASIGATGDTIVSQRISVDKMVDLDVISGRPGIGQNITAALQDTDAGRAIRSQIYRQMYDQGDTVARTLGRNPSIESIDNVFRDYIGKIMNKVAPDADVLRWANADGTFNYVVRKQAALVGNPSVVGRITAKGFVPHQSTLTPTAPEAPKSSTMVNAAEEGLEGASKFGRLGRTTLRRTLMCIPMVDIVTQQVTYEDSAYTGDRPLDAFLNLTVAEIWEIPIAVYSITELGAHGLMVGGSAVGDAANSALEAASKELVEPWYAPLEREIKNLYGVPF